jgi:multiple antibiotic resistance protein
MDFAVLTLLQTAPATEPHAYVLSASKVFLFFFIMLGPLKLIGPYFMQTRALTPTQARTMAWKVYALSVVAILVAAFLGETLLKNWQISPPVMQLAAGLVFLLVALQMVLSQYDTAPPHPANAPPEPQLMRLVFPVAVTPYGVATVIALMALSADLYRSFSVLGLALAVMTLNLLAMLFARWVMRGFGPLLLQILGAVLGILQVALALQFIVMSLGQMGLRISG